MEVFGRTASWRWSWRLQAQSFVARRKGRSALGDAVAPTEGAGDCLVLAQYYYPERIGSAPYCTDLAEQLARGTAKIRVLTCRPCYPSQAEFPSYNDGSRDREVINGVEIFRVVARQRRSGGALARLTADLAFLRRALLLAVKRKLQRADTVVVFVPSILSVITARLLCRPSGRIIAVIHDIESGVAKGLGLIKHGKLIAGFEWLERSMLNAVSSIVVLTPQMEQTLRGIGVTRPVEVLPIWANVEAAAPEYHTTIMYSGNFGRKQGLHQLIRLSERIGAQYLDVRVIMQGDGSERSQLEEEVRRRGLHHVQFRGLVPKSELLDSLRRADIHIVPQDSRAANYAMPSKVASIMAVGRPLVCTAAPGSALFDLMASSGAGLCVPPDDPEALFEAVATLIRSPELRAQLGENGARYVRERLNARQILARYEQLILEG
jgi:colanic acid biosynthesis glycosyl transferase WcaI